MYKKIFLPIARFLLFIFSFSLFPSFSPQSSANWVCSIEFLRPGRGARTEREMTMLSHSRVLWDTMLLYRNNFKIKFVDFTGTMTIGSYVEQLERTKQVKEADLIYYGIVLFGSWDKISELTRKFSLWK